MENIHGLEDKVIIRAYTLKAEKTEVYKYFDTQGDAQQRFAVSDEFVTQFATLRYLNDLAIKYDQVRAQGDPCCKLKDISLAEVIACKIIQVEDSPLQQLCTILDGYRQAGFSNTNV
ncbi:hypothetical protein OIDMADRAFT_48080 [Oidiodendron maius Zn]|uniref:Uncharacterized protein n=1 Tax=Oidiodendron maius (strain Zn) TaxID=913774 RepID=A0A0C3DA47_OIDMZ|nr:hypothetical protein OIDMADRAFT_48080 [Oidiodendron maius Zn]